MGIGTGIVGGYSESPEKLTGSGISGPYFEAPAELMGSGIVASYAQDPEKYVGSGFSAPYEEETPMVTEIQNVTAEQRAGMSYIVDIGFEGRTSSPKSLTVEYSTEGVSGPWSVASPQLYDRKHDAPDPFPVNPAYPSFDSFNFAWTSFQDLPEGDFPSVYVRVSLNGVQEIAGPISISTILAVTEDVSLERALLRKKLVSRAALNPLGYGLLGPMERGSRDFLATEGRELVRACVKTVLRTNAAIGDIMGELRWRPDFGQTFWVLRHGKSAGTIIAEIEGRVKQALGWEPRVFVSEVEAEIDEPGSIRVRIRYDIREVSGGKSRVVIPDVVDIVEVAT